MVRVNFPYLDARTGMSLRDLLEFGLPPDSTALACFGLLMLQDNGHALYVSRAFLLSDLAALSAANRGIAQLLLKRWPRIRVVAIPTPLHGIVDLDHLGRIHARYCVELLIGQLEWHAIRHYKPHLNLERLNALTDKELPQEPIFPDAPHFFDISIRNRSMRRLYVLPHEPKAGEEAGIYVAYRIVRKKSIYLYVGRAINLRRRVESSRHHRLSVLERDFPDARIMIIPARLLTRRGALKEADLKRLEYEAILHYRPIFNERRAPATFAPRSSVSGRWPVIPWHERLDLRLRYADLIEDQPVRLQDSHQGRHCRMRDASGLATHERA